MTGRQGKGKIAPDFQAQFVFQLEV